jgi:hypothetical protein
MNKVFVFMWLVGGGIMGPLEYETTASCLSLQIDYQTTVEQYGGGTLDFDCEPSEPEKEME